MAERVPLRDISSLTWEHPADAAALQSLRAVPGFDAVLRAVFGLFAERTLRLMHLGGSVEVSPKQLSQINRVYEEVLGTLDAPPTLPPLRHPEPRAQRRRRGHGGAVHRAQQRRGGAPVPR